MAAPPHLSALYFNGVYGCVHINLAGTAVLSAESQLPHVLFDLETMLKHVRGVRPFCGFIDGNYVAGIARSGRPVSTTRRACIDRVWFVSPRLNYALLTSSYTRFDSNPNCAVDGYGLAASLC